MSKGTDNEFLSRKMSYETASRIVQRLFHELCVQLAQYAQDSGSHQGLPRDRRRYSLWWLPRRAETHGNWMTEELKERLITTLKSIPELVKDVSFEPRFWNYNEKIGTIEYLTLDELCSRAGMGHRQLTVADGRGAELLTITFTDVVSNKDEFLVAGSMVNKYIRRDERPVGSICAAPIEAEIYNAYVARILEALHKSR